MKSGADPPFQSAAAIQPFSALFPTATKIEVDNSNLPNDGTNGPLNSAFRQKHERGGEERREADNSLCGNFFQLLDRKDERDGGFENNSPRHNWVKLIKV